MTDYAEPNLRKISGAAKGVRAERRMRLLPAFMMAAIVIMVVLALIIEARMTPDERAGLFEAYARAFP